MKQNGRRAAEPGASPSAERRCAAASAAPLRTSGTSSALSEMMQCSCPSKDGTKARAPVAIRMLRAVTRRPPTSTVWASTSLPRPSMYCSAEGRRAGPESRAGGCRASHITARGVRQLSACKTLLLAAARLGAATSLWRVYGRKRLGTCACCSGARGGTGCKRSGRFSLHTPSRAAALAVRALLLLLDCPQAKPARRALTSTPEFFSRFM